jgi:hypothetical protein
LNAAVRALPLAALLCAASLAHGQRADPDALPGNRAEPLGACGGGARLGAAAVNEGACDGPLEISGTPTRLRCGAGAIGAFEMCGHSLERAAAARLTGEPHDVMFGDAQSGWSVQASDERDGQAVSTVIVSLRGDRVFQVDALSFERNGSIAQQLRCEVRTRPG